MQPIMSITIQEINRLRQLTGVGIIDCKKALVEADGDLDKAIELLRKKGQKIAAVRADNQVKEGMVVAGTSKDGTYGVIFSLNSETDFVANNDQFRQLADQILELALVKRPANLQELKALSLAGHTVEEKVIELISKMGENIRLAVYESLTSDIVISYIHAGSRLGVLVGLQGNINETSSTVGKDIALQVAALQPMAIDKDGIPSSILDKEMEIAREQSKDVAKTPTILENIVQGRLSKFIKENTLLNQEFVKDPSITVSQYLNKLAPGLKVVAFKRIAVDMN
jgi:elongation factor Ts